MKTSIKVIEALLNSSGNVSIKDLSISIKADYRITHTAVQRLRNQKILGVTPVGSVRLCHLLPGYFGHELYEAECRRREKLLQSPNLRQVYRDIMEGLPSVHCTLLYVPAMQLHSNSMILGITHQPTVAIYLNKVLSLVPLPIISKCITEQEFIQQRHQPGSVANIAFKNYIILHGVDSYYRLKGQ